MPSPHKSLCIFGDSNMGCIKHALNQNLVQVPDGMNVEFWGANGAMFRGLDLIDGVLVPRPDALETVLMVNGNGRKVLDPKDFDAVFFMGVRIRANDFVAPLMHKLKTEDEFLSAAVIRQCCRDWFPNQRFYLAAKAFAASGHTKVIFSCTSLQMENFPEFQKDMYLAAPLATRQDVDLVWAEFDRIAQADDITFLPQMRETITSEVFTKEQYVRHNVDGTLDRKHRNPEYGALLLRQVLAHC